MGKVLESLSMVSSVAKVWSMVDGPMKGGELININFEMPSWVRLNVLSLP
jgi:hypothetical protein